MVSYWHLRKPKAFGNASSRFYSADGRMLAGHGAELNEDTFLDQGSSSFTINLFGAV